MKQLEDKLKSLKKYPYLPYTRIGLCDVVRKSDIQKPTPFERLFRLRSNTQWLFLELYNKCDKSTNIVAFPFTTDMTASEIRMYRIRLNELLEADIIRKTREKYTYMIDPHIIIPWNSKQKSVLHTWSYLEKWDRRRIS